MIRTFFRSACVAAGIAWHAVSMLFAASLMLLAMAVSACATGPHPLEARGAPIRVTGQATLTVWGPYETGLNQALAKLTAIANTASADLDAGRIDIATARSISSRLAQAEVALMASRRGDAKNPSPENILALAEAQRLLAIAASLLPETRK